jgi:hypothetical protein
MYVRKEALFSSQIEGTQSSPSDLLLFESAEAPGVPLDDVQEVSSYVSAMNFGLDRLRGGFPLSLRLIREIHAVLLAKGRGPRQTHGHALSRYPVAGDRAASAITALAKELVLASGKAEPLDAHDGAAGLGEQVSFAG